MSKKEKRNFQVNITLLSSLNLSEEIEETLNKVIITFHKRRKKANTKNFDEIIPKSFQIHS
jgi:hypothetical protein